MALRQIVTDPDPILRKKSRPVGEINERINSLLDDMADTLHKAEGVGLAAVQVGILKRIVIVETVPGELYEMINPVIIKKSKKLQRSKEGCLSLPGKWGETERPQAVVVRYTDRTGAEKELAATDFLAQAICHELDHLEGILYTDVAVGMMEDED